MNANPRLSRRPRVRRPVLLVALTVSLPVLLAVDADKTKNPLSSEQVVTMSEFTVRPESQAGYVASEVMSGSRIPTKIKDLPFSINVVTSELMDDYAILDNSLLFEGGMVSYDQSSAGSRDGPAINAGGYIVRGISNTGQLYNGFWQPAGIPVPNALKEREEILKGPSAGAYGQTSPGGIRNIVTKTPKTRPAQTLRLGFGNYNTREARLEATGPLNDRTAYLAILSYDQRDFNQPWHWDSSRTLALSVDRKLGASSHVKVDMVAVNQRNHSPSSRVPYLFNSVTQKYYGFAYDLFELSGIGPNSYKNVDNYTASAILEHKLNDVFSMRAGGNLYSVHNRSFNTTDTTAYDPDPTHRGTNPNVTNNFYGLTRFRGANSSFTAPSYRRDHKDGGAAQMDLLARYSLLNRRIENRTLLTMDYSSMYNYLWRKGMPTNPSVNADGTPRLSSDGSVSTSSSVDTAVFPVRPRFAGDTAYWLPLIVPFSGADPITGQVLNEYNVPPPSSDQYVPNSWQKSRTDVLGVMLRQQSTLWERWHAFASLRFDHVSYNNHVISFPVWNPIYRPLLAPYYQRSYEVRNPDPISSYSSSATTPGAGVSYRVTSSLSAYANYSTSFKTSVQRVSGATTGAYFLPNEKARGYDYGFKAGMLNDRLTWSLGGYYVIQDNISVTVDDGFGGTTREASGSVVSRGGEFSANYNVNSNWAVNVGYFYTDAFWVDAGTDVDLLHRQRSLVPKDMANLKLNYRFSGDTLRGLRLGTMIQYNGEARAEDGGGTSVRINNVNVVPRGSNNGLRELKLPSVTLISLTASYDFKARFLGDRAASHRLQFNVGNLTDERYVTYSRGSGDYRTYRFTYQISR